MNGSSPRDITIANLAPLIQGLEDDDPLVPPQAARLLGELAQPEAVMPLLQHAQQSTRYNKNAAVDALRCIGDSSVAPALRELSEHPNVWKDFFWFYEVLLRASAALAAKVLDPGGPEGFLEREVTKPTAAFNSFLIYYAPVILPLPESAPVITDLKTALWNAADIQRIIRPSELIRIVKAFGSLDCEKSLTELKRYTDFPSRYVRGEAVFQLARRLPDAEGESFLYDFLAREQSGFARMKAQVKLTFRGKKSANEELRRILRDPHPDPLDRTALLESLASEKLCIDFEDLTPSLSHPSAPLRRAAVALLEQFPESGGSAACKRLFEDSDTGVRLQACKSNIEISSGGGR